MAKMGYHIDKGRVPPVGRFPNIAKRSSCGLGSLGSYFFLLSCSWRTREISAIRNRPNSNKSCHVTTRTALSIRLGVKEEYHPRKRSRGTAYRGTGSTSDSITQDFSKCKQKPRISEEIRGFWHIQSLLTQCPEPAWRQQPSGSRRCWHRQHSCPPCRTPWRHCPDCGRCSP